MWNPLRLFQTSRKFQDPLGLDDEPAVQTQSLDDPLGLDDEEPTQKKSGGEPSDEPLIQPEASTSPSSEGNVQEGTKHWDSGLEWTMQKGKWVVTKNETGAVGEVGQVADAELNKSFSEKYSGKRPSNYPLQQQPVSQPSGFKTNINLGQPQQVAPTPITAPAQITAPKAPKKSSFEIVRDDYLNNKIEVDKTLTAAIGDDPLTGHYVEGEGLLKNMLNPADRDTKLLTRFSKKRREDFDKELETRIAELNKKYPTQAIHSAGVGNMPYVIPRGPEYYSELEGINKDVEGKRESLMEAVRKITAHKILGPDLQNKNVAEPKFVTKVVGREIRRAMADPTLASEERREQKGIELKPSEKYYNDKVGYIAMAEVLKDMEEAGVDIASNPMARKLFDNVKEGKAKLLSDNKDFARQQAASLISDEIFRDKNWFQVMFGAYTINDKDIKKYGEKLGIPSSIVNLVGESDVRTANMFGEFANELAARPGANMGTFIGRPFRREVLGQDPDAIDAHYEDLNKRYTTFLANAPEAMSQFSNPYKVEGDSKSEAFLEDVKNLNQGKFNWSPSVVANTIANGAGQMIQYGLGGTATGGVLRGAGKLISAAEKGMIEHGVGAAALKGGKFINAGMSVERSKDIGLVTYGFMNSFEQGYQDARVLVGDDPKNEGMRNLVASLKAGVQAFSELIFPDYKVTDKLFRTGIKNTGTQILLNELAKDGVKALSKVSGKKALTQVIKEGIVKTGTGTAKETGEEVAALLGDVVISVIANPKALDNRDIPQELLQTIVVTAISSVLPIGVAEFRAGPNTSGLTKSMIHEMGSDRDTYVAHVNDEILNGKVTQAHGNKKISIINTASDIVKNHVPAISPVNNRPLTEKDKVDYSYNLLHQAMLDKSLETTTDEVQKAIIEKQIKDLKLEREGILQRADGIEKNFDGKPIYDRDNQQQQLINEAVEMLPKPEETEETARAKRIIEKNIKEEEESLKPQGILGKAVDKLLGVKRDRYLQRLKVDRELLNSDPLKYFEQQLEFFKNDATEEYPNTNFIKHYEDAIENLKNVPVHPLYGGMDPEQTIRHIAEQAQNVQSDGSVSNLQSAMKAYDAAVSAFGQPLVDAAIAAHPFDSLVKPGATQKTETETEETIPIRNDDFVKKYFKEGTPERKSFDALDEEGQSKMIADKREELKFAPKAKEPTRAEKIIDIENRRAQALAANKKLSEINPALGSEEELAKEINEKYDKELKTLAPKQLITKQDEKDLMDLGYSEQDIFKMKTDDAGVILANKTKKPEEKKEEKVEEPVYRTEAEAAALINVKVPFGKNYKNTVEYEDIVTGEKKSAKTHTAKDELVKRHESLTDFIKCLT